MEVSETEPPAGMQGSPGPLFRLVRDQRVAFLLVGVANTGIGLAWFRLFQLIFSDSLGQFGYFAYLGCAHVASVLCAFVLYRTFVFRVRGHLFRDLGRFEMVYLVALGVNAVALPLLVQVAHFAVFPSQVLIVFLTTLISFFGHRYFSFRRTRDTATHPSFDTAPTATKGPH